MNKKVLWAAAAAAALVLILMIRSVSDSPESTDFAYHVLLADPEKYKGGAYTESFVISAGSYEFRFIPNGDSPRTLSIQLAGESFLFSEDFELEGTPHRTQFSEYFTWDYTGDRGFVLDSGQDLEIMIDPNGNTVGTVSVMIVRP
ncbi:hypothetical protein CENSYa_1883 [Cenarchaeum symbiosum A]|uniref:Uncharacterized protein n=1 Tax=Cenarchaeum symbiosum (strain A) TaxID=414004 RepID=A0RYS5_CENSY|nr:hypothetical protein CENSYa_1883 [Cenarchaeum symbiosum A]